MFGIVWMSIAGGKKLKGGVAMDSPARMNVIAELIAAASSGRLSIRVLRWSE
jgi:hypothetical protein